MFAGRVEDHFRSLGCWKKCVFSYANVFYQDPAICKKQAGNGARQANEQVSEQAVRSTVRYSTVRYSTVQYVQYVQYVQCVQCTVCIVCSVCAVCTVCNVCT